MILEKYSFGIGKNMPRRCATISRVINITRTSRRQSLAEYAIQNAANYLIAAGT